MSATPEVSADIARLVGRSRFLASGQDDPHSATIDELCDLIERLVLRIATIEGEYEALTHDFDRLADRENFYVNESERMREALEPFDEALGEDDDDDFADDTPVVVNIGRRTTLHSLTLGDFRKARTALKSDRMDGEGNDHAR